MFLFLLLGPQKAKDVVAFGLLRRKIFALGNVRGMWIRTFNYTIIYILLIKHKMKGIEVINYEIDEDEVNKP
jgi:hypothetical protein